MSGNFAARNIWFCNLSTNDESGDATATCENEKNIVAFLSEKRPDTPASPFSESNFSIVVQSPTYPHFPNQFWFFVRASGHWLRFLL
jgi:hypothetical protein